MRYTVMMVACQTVLILCLVAVAIAQDTPEKKLAKASNDFALKLFKHQGNLKGRFANILFSPLSITMAVGMLNLGAKGNTKTQIEDVLGFKTINPELNDAFKNLLGVITTQGNEYTLDLANRAYVQESNFTILDQFKTNIETHFEAQVEKADFLKNADGARTNINKWVSDMTKTKIPELLKSDTITPATVMVLVNSVYYKAAWKFMFGKHRTEKRQFYLTSKKTFDVDMMQYNDTKVKTKYVKSPDFSSHIVELPYEGEKVSMYLVVPYSTDGLPQVEEEMDLAKLEEVLDKKMTQHEVSLKMPKFSIKFGVDLKTALQELGVTDVFDPTKADLSGINGEKDLVVSDAVHESTIDVDEEGTEATAATAVVISITSIQKTATVNVNRPFMFVIREKDTGAFLFLGRYAIPNGAEGLVNGVGTHSSVVTALIAGVLIALSTTVLNVKFW